MIRGYHKLKSIKLPSVLFTKGDSSIKLSTEMIMKAVVTLNGYSDHAKPSSSQDNILLKNTPSGVRIQHTVSE